MFCLFKKKKKRDIIHGTSHTVTLNFNAVLAFETQIIVTEIGIIRKHLSTEHNYTLKNCWHINGLHKVHFVGQNPEISNLAIWVVMKSMGFWLNV